MTGLSELTRTARREVRAVRRAQRRLGHRQRHVASTLSLVRSRLVKLERLAFDGWLLVGKIEKVRRGVNALP